MKSLIAIMKDDISERILERMKVLITESGMSVSNKSAFTNLFRKHKEILDLLDECLTDVLHEYELKYEAMGEIKSLKAEIDSLDNEVMIREMEIQGLKDKMDEILKETERVEEGFTDERAREAYRLYTKISTAQKGDDNFMRHKRVQMAGITASAYLGMSEYNVGRIIQQETKE